MVVGGGPAGLEAALTLARAGHKVTVAEAGEEMGGRLIKETKIRNLSAWGRVRDYRLYQLQQMGNVNLYTGSSLDAEGIAEFGADHVLVATGASWVGDGLGRTRLSPIPGFAGAALTPDDILGGQEPGETVVIYDDDHYYMANALAADLASKGHRVHIVTPQPTLSAWMGMTLEAPRVIGEMNELGVAMHINTTAKSWEDGALHLHRSDTGTPLDAIKADTLIGVTIRHPDPTLSVNLDKIRVTHRRIGDAEVPGTVQAAVYSGHRHAREILNGGKRIPFKRERAVIFDTQAVKAS